MVQQYFNAYWLTDYQKMDELWAEMTAEERYFVETRGCAPWQIN